MDFEEPNGFSVAFDGFVNVVSAIPVADSVLV